LAKANRPGPPAARVRRSPTSKSPDGYTLASWRAGTPSSPFLYPKLQYAVFMDFTPISLSGNSRTSSGKGRISP